MVNYTLSEGDNITVSTDTTIENFYYRGGSIDVPPGITFSMSGEFFFSPTSSSEPVDEKIYSALVTRIELETGANGKFTGFQLYNTYPRNSPLFFPCIVFGNIEANEENIEYMFGGETIQKAGIVCDLAFKTSEIREIGGINIDREDLAYHYLTNMREVVKDIVFSNDYVNIGAIKEESSIQKPQEQNQTLYGFSMEIFVDYKTPTN